MNAAPATTNPALASPPDAWQVRLFYDGQCPMCVKEARLLERLDRGRGRLECVDLLSPTFDPASLGRTHDQLMDRIHGQLPDGMVIEGVEVFRRAYAAVGWGWLLAWTRWPLARPLTDMAYRWFARHRVRIGSIFGRHCESGACGVPLAQRRDTRGSHAGT